MPFHHPGVRICLRLTNGLQILTSSKYRSSTRRVNNVELSVEVRYGGLIYLLYQTLLSFYCINIWVI